MIAGFKPYPTMKDSGVEWLGQAPEHWEVPRLGNLLRERGETNANGEVQEVLSVLRDRGVIPYAEKGNIGNKRSEDITRYKIVRPDDIVVNCMNVIIGSVGLSKYTGCLSPVYYVLTRRSESDDPKYLNAYFQTKPFQRSLVRIGNGILAHRMRIPMELLKCELFPRPPLPEQSAIVRYLDHVDRRVRRLVRAKRKLIVLLTEQKQAIIHRAVTRGLDPDVPLKDSRVEWLGQVPEHWQVRRLGQVAVSFRTGPFGSILHQSDYVEGGTPLVNPIHMHDGRIVEDKRCTVPAAVVDRLSNYVLAKYDIVFSRRGELGRCVLVRDREVGWLCGTGSIRIRVAYAGIEPEYLIEALQVRWVGEYLSLFSVGATMESLNTGILKGVPILLPPQDEQREILRRTPDEAKIMQRALDDANREIALLNEYRVRLIADVVTGKLDVREAAAALPEFDPLAHEDERDDALDVGDETDIDELDATSEEAEV
jgi:type I restriction enzyme S subunit